MNDTAASNGAVTALLLAAGLGTRLRPLTDQVAKCLVEIDGRPLLDYWIETLAGAHVRHVRVNTHHLVDQVRAYIEAVNRTGAIRLVESYEPRLLGSAGTVRANRKLAEGARDVIIVYADNLSEVDLDVMLSFHRTHNDPMTMLLFRAQFPSRCGIVQLDDAGRVIEFVEKPEEPKGNLANAGVYIVTADAYREIADLNAFDLGFEVLPSFIGRTRGFVLDGYHRDIGTLESLEQARCDVEAGRALLRNRS